MAVRSAAQASQATIVGTAGAVGRWVLVAEKSRIGFDLKKFWGAVTVRGSFADAAGDVAVGEDGSVRASLDIAAASVDTGQRKRDEHLRSADFFDVEQFPTMHVRIDQVELVGPQHGTAHGRLTILGTTRPVSFPVDVALGSNADVAEVTARLTVDRGQFGITWNPARIAGMAVNVDARLAFRKVEA